jgi:hypothetical protein
MLNLVEMVVGLGLIYFGLSRFGGASQGRGVLYALVALAGLVLAVHGLLIYQVPDFFKPSV